MIVLGARFRVAFVADQSLRDNGPMLRLLVTEVGLNGGRPIDVRVSRLARVLR
jgi:hypothetical protein